MAPDILLGGALYILTTHIPHIPQKIAHIPHVYRLCRLCRVVPTEFFIFSELKLVGTRLFRVRRLSQIPAGLRRLRNKCVSAESADFADN